MNTETIFCSYCDGEIFGDAFTAEGETFTLCFHPPCVEDLARRLEEKYIAQFERWGLTALSLRQEYIVGVYMLGACTLRPNGLTKLEGTLDKQIKWYCDRYAAGTFPERRDARGGRMPAQDGEALSRHSPTRATLPNK